MSELTVSRKDVPDAQVIILEGVIDASTSATLESVLKTLAVGAKKRVVIDMTGVDFVNSAGWGMLLERAEKVISSGGTFTLAGMQEDVSEIFQLLGLSKVIRRVESIQDALEMTGGADFQ